MEPTWMARLRPLTRHPPNTSTRNKPMQELALWWFTILLGWVITRVGSPVNTHSTPVPGTPGRLWVARVMVTARHTYLFNLVAEQVSVQDKSAQPACCQRCRSWDERNKITFETHCESQWEFPPVRQRRNYRMHTCGPLGTCVDGVNSHSCESDPGSQEKDIDEDSLRALLDDCGAFDCSSSGDEMRLRI